MFPLWIEQIRNSSPITLTEPAMTRFIAVTSEEAKVDLSSSICIGNMEQR
ncbi:MAG: polysaccharide biosynthesis protein [Enterocloster sp.]